MLAEETRSLGPEQLLHDAEPSDSPIREDSDLIPAKKTRRRRVKTSPSETSPMPEDAEESASTTPKRRKRRMSKQALDGKYRLFVPSPALDLREVTC